MSVLFLEADNWILQQVAHLDTGSPDQDVRVLLHHEPAHVTEEESPFRVMRISVCLTELVVNTMITAPLVNVILTGRRLHDHEEDPER